MLGLLTVSMAVVVGYCLARAAVPAWAGAEHRRDLDLWHVAMAGVMVAMFLTPLGRPAALTALGVFAVGLGWAVLRAVAPAGRAAYVRLGVGCAAMLAMLVPALGAAPASAAPGHAMGPSSHVATTRSAVGWSVPTPLVTGLVIALAGILVVRLVVAARRTGTVPGRLEACCDVLMAGAMGAMLLGWT